MLRCDIASPNKFGYIEFSVHFREGKNFYIHVLVDSSTLFIYL
jgi:hypothetical protein